MGDNEQLPIVTPAGDPLAAPPEPPGVTPEPSPAPPHPLDPGGARFNEVYGRMKEAEARAETLQAQVTTQRATPPAAAAPPRYTPHQLQAFVDAAQITPAQMAAQLSLQAKEEAKVEMREEWQAAQRSGRAQEEVREYLRRVPALASPASSEFTKVAAAAWEIAEELGLEVHDPRVQRRALREVIGTLDRVPTVTIRAPAPYAEAQPGGGSPATRPGASVFKGIPEWQMQYWKTQGYSDHDMEAEAKIFHERAARGVGSIRMRRLG